MCGYDKNNKTALLHIDIFENMDMTKLVDMTKPTTPTTFS